MSPWRIAVLLLATYALASTRSVNAQDRILYPDDPLARVDSVVVSAAGLFRIPDSILLSTLEAAADRQFLSRLGYVVLDDSTGSISGAEVARGYVFIRYRPLPAENSIRLAATPAIGPPNPDSVSSFIPVTPAREPVSTGPDDASRLTRSGSITRGIIAGNRRDATIESGLRMQLGGEIVDGVRLRAVLSDENTPIVPEGTTQRINEFDRVFIEVESGRARAELGDFELAMGASSYASLSRKLQGAQVSALWPEGIGQLAGTGSATFAGAAARGIFRSQQIEAVEGVQGPYRLEGNNGERFIVLIPGSETVYVDGNRLERGETEDYVVDYATAEVTFTPRRIMSADRRILVEFQYTTNQFTRTLLATEVQSGLWRRPDGSSRARFAFTLLREADGNQFVDEFGLTAADSLLLAAAGDERASRSGAMRVDYDPEAPYVHYVRRPAPDAADTIFVAIDSAPSDSEAVYRVQFSRVTTGGRYIRVGRSINGIAFEYAGAGQGEYEPIRILPQPRRQQLFDFRASLSPIRNLRVEGEWARSFLDLNRLSPLDAADNIGDVYTIGGAYTTPAISLPALSETSFLARFSHSVRDANFVSFDRVRSVEYTRDWNIPFDVSGTGGAVSGAREISTSASVGASSDVGSLSVELGELSIGDVFNADRRVGRVASADSTKLAFRYLGEQIQSDSRSQNVSGSWLRHSGRLGYTHTATGVTPYLEIEYENRRETSPGSDSLTSRSIRFTEIRPGLSLRRNEVTALLEAELRREDRPVFGMLRDAATARTIQGSVRYRPSGPLRAEANIGVRRSNAESSEFAGFGIEDRKSVLLGLSGDYRPLQRAITLTWLYEGQTERTPRLQEVYIRIGPEQGEYVWLDTNGDGAVQIEEFVRETTPNEGTYARTFVPSDSLFSIVSVKARGRIDIRPERLLRGQTSSVARMLSLVSSSTTLEVSEKNRSGETLDIYTLRQSRFRQSGQTLNGRLLLRQDLSLAKPTSRVGADISLSRIRTLADLAAGLEERDLSISEASMRYRLNSQWRLRFGGRLDRNKVESANFSSRTFDLRSRALSAEASVNPSTSLSLTGTVDATWREDGFSDRGATVLKFPVEIRYQLARRYQVSTRVEVANVTVTGGSSTGLAEFELTDGRGRGLSSLWSVVGQWAFNANLRGSIAYDGRAPADAPVIHTVRMQLSAVF